MTNILSQLKKELKSYYNEERAEHSKRFFKTGKGQYGEGDIFLGMSTPMVKDIVKKYNSLNLSDCELLLHSKIHEERTVALLILVYQFEKGNELIKRRIFNIYIKNTLFINNWDLVDITAPNIIGNYLFEKNRELLYKFAKSNMLWEKRISIVSTLFFIRKNDFKDTLKISEILLNDKEDLIHKATGWMLREVGKRDEKTLLKFLDKYHKIMPRTMLRYSIEKFSQDQRKKYMEK